ncbi:MAG: hypothetical protein H7124_12780 [Phycisphaerales bacterium]|nr:hypothetical protein [Hyphomonadaceae bacterium]
MDTETAHQIDRLARHALGQLNDVLLVARASCPEDEFVGLKSSVGRIMGAIVTDVLQPLYARHPDIIPTELK